MTMNVSNYEFKNGLYLPRENSRQGLRYEINFSEEQRREAIKQRTRDAVAKKPKPKLNKNAQEYLKKIQQKLATTGEATQLVPTAKHPLAGAAYASRQTALERLWGPQVLDLGNGATSTTYFGTAEELRNVAPLGNIAPDAKSEFQKAFEKSQLFKSTNGNSVNKLGKQKQNKIAEELKHLIQLASTPEEKQMLQERIAKFKGGNDKALFSGILEGTVPTPAPTTAEVKPPQTVTQKAMYDKVWKEELMPKMEAGFKANENKLTQSVLPSTGIAPNRNFIAEANEVASNHKAPTPAPTAVEVKPPQTVIGNAEIPTIQNESVVKPEAPTAQIPQESKPISPVASEAEAVTPKPKLKPEGGKSSKGFWGKIFKSKGGKIGAGVALTGALVYGAYKLFGGDDNKNAEVKQNNPVQEQKATAPADTTATQKETPVAEEAKPEVKSETNTEAKPVVTPVPVAENDSIAKADVATEVEKADDAKAVVAKPETEEAEEAEKTEEAKEAKEAEEAEEAKKAEEELNEWIAQKGENYWKYAKQELIFEHQGQAGYKPTNNEINERMLKIMERNGVKFANDGIHSDPMLKIGDKVKVKFGTEEKAA